MEEEISKRRKKGRLNFWIKKLVEYIYYTFLIRGIIGYFTSTNDNCNYAAKKLHLIGHYNFHIKK